MSMVPCPECGLPRSAEQVAGIPCPVCAAVASESQDSRPAPVAKPVHDPTAGLPADAGQLHLVGNTGGFPPWFGMAAVFLLGIAAGVGGLLAWQLKTAAPEPDNGAETRPTAVRPLQDHPAKRIEIAPMPHEPAPRPEVEPEVETPRPEPKIVALPPERVTVVELNQPDGTYTLPLTMKKGERVVLKGKVKVLRLHSLDGGSELDASGLEAAIIHIGGRIAGRSSVKLNSPNGIVHVLSSVGERSSVEINAPNGEVRFISATTPSRPGSSIDGGAVVDITARFVDLRGDVNGIETRVTVNIPSDGTLRVAAVRGIATVQYRVAAGKGMPEVNAAVVSPTAVFKQIN